MPDPATHGFADPGEDLAPTFGQTEATRVAPDVAEQALGSAGLDPTLHFSFHDQPVVGLGGSAGSLSHLQTFFSRTPPETGLVFVVVMHLSPEHESALAEILQRTTTMPVTQVRERVKVKPNHVYVIAPGKHLTMLDGHLGLSELERERGRRVAVDLFFRTLADTHGPHAVAVVLSGADSDGAIGIKRIKERGGLTIAQDPKECEHAGMPRSAIETGLVDWVLRAEEMPARILEFRQRGRSLQLPHAAEVEAPATKAASGDAGALREVLAVIRARTGRDFASYKPGTVLRRIGRRMQVNGMADLAAYHAFLRTNPGETGALLQDLLISVTNFFRDRDAFEHLETIVPALFNGKGPSDVVRVWVAACATGEEAYSIAILLSEYAATLEAPPRIQVFATDLDEMAVNIARAAVYPETIMADVSEERLRRFFVRHQDKYRVNQALREVVLFAIHDILRDAPFSQLDLVSCRNLLIYLNRASQKRCFDLFHFALRTGGHLFLGTSETADDAAELFAALHKKHRIYTRRAARRTGLPVPSGPLTLTLALQGLRGTHKVVSPADAPPANAPTPVEHGAESRGLSASELHFKLVETFAPPSAVVNRDSQIVHLSANVSRFLQLTGGEPTTNLLQLVHPMLRVELRAALFQAAESQAAIEVQAVPIELEPGATRLVDISVRTARNLAPDLFLVVFNERQTGDTGLNSAHRPAEPEGVVRSLERELELLKQQLRSSVEQHGATTEEMKASNEELQAMNEELRSAAEELETSREELQSINEELSTVNLELKGKVDELSRANSDLQNLMAATNIATIFVDRELCIQRYTPSSVAVFHLIPSDVGRPLGDLRHRLEFDTIVGDASQVLRERTPNEREMRAASGRWFLVRIMPYWNADQSLGGVVLTFLDITERKQAEDSVRASEARFRGIVDQTGAGICLLDREGRLTFANPRMGHMLGWPEAELVGKSISELTFPGDPDPSRAAFEALLKHRPLFQIEQRLARRDGTGVWVSLSVSGVRDGMGDLASCVAVVVDIAARKDAEDQLQQAKTNLERRVQERTAELDVSNRALRVEISERAKAEAGRQEMMRALVAAQEAERGRISRDLHDRVGQQVMALLLGLKSLENDLKERSENTTVVQSLQAIAGSIGEDLHEVAVELRPTALDDLGLVRALSTFLEDWIVQAKIAVQFDHENFGPARLPAHVETTVYRIVCEALQNALKHSRAGRVSVILQRSKDGVTAIVEDDGVGFDLSAPGAPSGRKHLGLVGMRERVALVNGELTLESEPGHGTTVLVRIPLTTP